MPATTATGLPYPLDTDAVMLGAQNIKGLADAIDRRIRVVTVSINIGSTSAHASNTGTVVLIPGLAVGDFCFWIGSGGTAGITFHYRTRSVCTVAGQILLDGFNADANVNDPAAVDHHFLVVAHA